MNHDCLISVIIPVYNCAKYLGAAIDSVLAQTYQLVEIIVVDDGSIDQSSQIAQSYGSLISYFYIDHSGISAALNYGISCGQGQYIAFLDHDDLWVADKLALQMEAFEQDPELDIVFGHLQQFKSPDLGQKTQDNLLIKTEIHPGHHKDTMLITSEALKRVGLFNTTIQQSNFLEWYLRAFELGLTSLMLPDILAKRRLHESNFGRHNYHSRLEYVRVLKASLDRRRQSGHIKSP